MVRALSFFADASKVFRRSAVRNKKQETQLSLTNRATRLEVSQVTKHGTIPYVRHGFLLVCYSNFVSKSIAPFFRYSTSKKVVILKSGSEALKVIKNGTKKLLFDRLCMVSY